MSTKDVKDIGIWLHWKVFQQVFVSCKVWMAKALVYLGQLLLFHGSYPLFRGAASCEKLSKGSAVNLDVHLLALALVLVLP